jgi:riboflavin kinase/FMN adenylyltransferase
MRVSFVQRIRDERTFDGVDALKAQIAADCNRARALFAKMSV